MVPPPFFFFFLRFFPTHHLFESWQTNREGLERLER
jgi:hypothetical protein